MVHKYEIKSAAKIFKKDRKNLRVKNKLVQNILELIYPKTLKIIILFKFKKAIKYSLYLKLVTGLVK